LLGFELAGEDVAADADVVVDVDMSGCYSLEATGWQVSKCYW